MAPSPRPGPVVGAECGASLWPGAEGILDQFRGPPEFPGPLAERPGAETKPIQGIGLDRVLAVDRNGGGGRGDWSVQGLLPPRPGGLPDAGSLDRGMGQCGPHPCAGAEHEHAFFFPDHSPAGS